MALEDYLSPGENITFASPTLVEYQGDLYEFYITDRRLIWYIRKGLIFKSDRVITENIGNVQGISYKEEGIFRKRGVIVVETDVKKLEFSGSREAMRAIYSEMQARM